MRHLIAYLIPFCRQYRFYFISGFLLILLTNSCAWIIPQYIKHVINHLNIASNEAFINPALFWIITLTVIKCIGLFGSRKILINASRHIEFDIRNQLFGHLLKLPLAYYHRVRTGDLMSRLTNDLESIRSVMGPGLMYSLTTLTLLIFVVPALLQISPSLTLFSCIPVLGIPFVVRKIALSIHHQYFKVQQTLGALTSLVQENFSGILLIKSAGLIENEKKRFANLNQQNLEQNIRLGQIYGLFYPGIMFLVGLGTVLFLGWGGYGVMSGRMDLGSFVAFHVYLGMLMQPLGALGWALNLFQRGTASWLRLQSILNEPHDQSQSLIISPFPSLAAGTLEIRNLHFQFINNGFSLKNITLKIPLRKKIAIIGPTGSGKTSLLNLLARLYPAPSRTIFLNGIDLNQLAESSFRKSICQVPQDSFVFADLIKNNISYPDFSLPQIIIEAAARQASLDDEIHGFPEKFEQEVGERGITLSGGQRQRTTLARAFSKNPEILLLDDCLSSVDAATEHTILTALNEQFTDLTLIMVSHRLSSIQNFDKIFVLDHGQLIEEGTHPELMSQHGLYQRTFMIQQLEKELI